MTLSLKKCQEITSTLREAGRSDLAEEVEAAFRPNDVLTSSEAADLLGVSSRNTVKNWLKDGKFPGAFQTDGGHWRFPREEVEKTRARMEELYDKNERGDVEPPEVKNPQDPPLL
jgi:excisionase family DNA binding protein